MKLEFQHGSRSRLLAFFVMGLMAVFVIRLFYLQIIQHDFYIAKAYEEQVKSLVIPAERGTIYGMDHDTPIKLVMNETVYTMIADPKTVKQDKEIIEAIREIAGGNARPALDELLGRKDTRYQVLATKLSLKQAEMLKEKKFTGIRLIETSQRAYPEGGLAAQTLGFVNAEEKGQYGIEERLNEELKGKDGMLQSVTDISNVPLTIGSNNINKPAQDGKNIVLSLDLNIQAYAEKALDNGLKKAGATNGSVIIMDPRTGKVMAMANLPTYRPAEFTKVQDAAAFNNAVADAPYEPGSVLKTFTLATGIDKGVVRPDSTFINKDKITIDDWTIENYTKGMLGSMTIQTALEWSHNTGFVTIAQRLGDGTNINRSARDTMYQYFHDRLKLGQRTGIELANESPGSLASPKTGEGNAVKYANVSFGQGMDATMLQVATGFSAIVNGGTYYKPTVLAGEVVDGEYRPNAAPQPVQTNVVNAETSNTVRAMMEEARRDAYSKLDKPGYSIGGKTGTAQVPTAGGYSKTETIGSYLGYGGVTTPEYVIMVAVSGKNKAFQGSRDAMPIFTDISNWLIDYLKLQPKG